VVGSRLSRLIQFLLQIVARYVACKEGLESGNGFFDDVRWLMHKLKTEVFDAVFNPTVEPVEIRLNLRVENRVAAPDICQNWMLSTAVVADRNLVLLTGVAAVAVPSDRNRQNTQCSV